LLEGRRDAQKDCPHALTSARDVLSVRPGLTGRWAVSGRSDLSYADRAELEYRYVEDWSFRMDLRILLRD
jgi:lipopolysaccharide/colanic/teichoic acid biosynthesis glycosyltransferase